MVDKLPENAEFDEPVFTEPENNTAKPEEPVFTEPEGDVIMEDNPESGQNSLPLDIDPHPTTAKAYKIGSRSGAISVEKLPTSESSAVKRKAKIFPCSLCYLELDTAKARHRHMRKVHKNRLAKCAECDFKFSTASALHSHVRKEHAPHKCIICSRRFFDLHNLEQHQKFRHLSAKPK